MRVSKFRMIVAGVATAASFGFLGAGTGYAIQIHMVNARNNLQQGLDELQRADADKGGHRDQAIDLVQRAIDQVNQGIQFADANP